MSTKKKELTLQETFYNLCKDLIRYIDRKIVKKYISPNQAQLPKEKRNQEKKYNDNIWRYFYESDETTEEEKIRDIFKDNAFLLNLQKLYNSLSIIVINMEENKKNIEILNEKIEKEEQQLKLTAEINNQLTKYLIENKFNLNNITQNDIINAFENLKNSNNTIKNIGSDLMNQYLNNNIINNYMNSFQNNINIQQNINNENINNEANKIENSNNINNNNNNQIPKKKNLFQNNSIPTLIQALESINKSKNNKTNNKVIHKNKILDSDSSDSDDESNQEENEEEKEINEEEEENKNIKAQKIKYKRQENEKKGNLLNKKYKRKKYNK